MAATRTPGITIDAHGNYFIDKCHHGTRICLRLGPTTIEQAELRLKREVGHVELELARRAHTRPLFRDCAARYLAQRHERLSLATMQIHMRLLLPHIGDLEPRQVHDATLAPFIASRVAAGASATTINRSLDVVRAILNRATRSYRDDDGTPWLTGVPPLITMLPESRRSPYPITRDEQDRLFPRLPAHLQRMALFTVNTGLRDSNVCGLQWSWEVPLPELERQRLCRAGRVVQEQARPRRSPQRRGVVDRAGAARLASDLGVSISGPSHDRHEQHRLAERAPRRRAGPDARA